MRALKLRLVQVALWLVCALFLRKMTKSSAAVYFLREQSEMSRQWQFAESKQLNETLQRIQSPAVIMLNKHALNITLNFLCNLRKFEKIHERLVVFAFDSYSHSVIQKSFADVSVIRWNLLALIQADTIWTQNLFEIIDVSSTKYKNADLIFDSEGEDNLLSSMVAGGYFFVRSSPITQKFFEEISNFLLNNFATDNNLMTRQCLQGLYGCRCASIPYGVISNWRGFSSSSTSIPPLFQYDGGDSSEGKFEQMRHQGFLFVNYDTLKDSSSTGVKCLPNTTGNSTETIARPKKSSSSKTNIVIRFAHGVFEVLCRLFPSLRYYVLTELFPRYAYYLVV